MFQWRQWHTFLTSILEGFSKAREKTKVNYVPSGSDVKIVTLVSRFGLPPFSHRWESESQVHVTFWTTCWLFAMGRSCVVYGCTTTSCNKEGISTHEFPTGPRERLWTRFVQTTRKDFKAPTKNSAICGRHLPPPPPPHLQLHHTATQIGYEYISTSQCQRTIGTRLGSKDRQISNGIRS